MIISLCFIEGVNELCVYVGGGEQRYNINRELKQKQKALILDITFFT